MIDRKKVLSGLECCRMNGKGCRQCPYNKECDEMPDFGNAYLCSDALELLKEQQEQKFFVDFDGKITPLPIHPQWISVKDRMPAETHSMFYKFYGTPKWRDAMWREESDHVLVAITFEDGSQFVTSGYTQDGKWSTGISKMLPYTVTHWMPLPEPPEVKQDD